MEYVMAKKKTKKATPRKVTRVTVKRKRRKITDSFIWISVTAKDGGVISTGAYQNRRPGWEAMVQPRRGANVDKILDHIENMFDKRFQRIQTVSENKAIEMQFRHIRSRVKGNEQYPSVTSILDYDKEWWMIDALELSQYAARGTIVHRIMKIYFETGKWIDPTKDKTIREEVALVLGGKKGFHWDDCSYIPFMENYKKRINIEEQNIVFYNDHWKYSGEIDAIGTFDGVKTLFDIKTGEYRWEQLAAYAAQRKEVKQLAIIPVGPCDNLTGFYQIKLNDNFTEHFKNFLKKREGFREKFGF